MSHTTRRSMQCEAGHDLRHCYRVSSNTPGNLLEIYKVSWKFYGLVCEFARLSLILVTILVFQSVAVQNILQYTRIN